MTEDFFELLPKANFTKRILATFIDYSIFLVFSSFMSHIWGKTMEREEKSYLDFQL